MEGEIPMSARRHATNKLRTAYQKASKKDRGRILDEVMATTGTGRSTARRMLTGPALPDPVEQVDRRKLRPKSYGDEARALLEHVRALMGLPCGKYFVVMPPIWLPLLDEAGDLAKPFATPASVGELEAMSPATIDRYLAGARRAMALKGIATTGPPPLLRNSIGISKAGDEPPSVPGVIEADTVAHCGPTLKGEFCRTLTMTDLVTGWTENASTRNNASKRVVQAVAELQGMFPFPPSVFGSDNGSEFINHDVADWLQERDIAQTRSRPHRKNDQVTVESKNNHVVRRHAFCWRYDTAAELDLLNQPWRLVSLRLNFFTPTKKPIGYATTSDGRRRRVYDKPKTPWQRVRDTGILNTEQTTVISARIEAVNPADTTREINHIQQQLTEPAKAETQAMTAARHLDMATLEPSIRRLQTTT